MLETGHDELGMAQAKTERSSNGLMALYWTCSTYLSNPLRLHVCVNRNRGAERTCKAVLVYSVTVVTIVDFRMPKN